MFKKVIMFFMTLIFALCLYASETCPGPDPDPDPDPDPGGPGDYMCAEIME